MVKENVQAVISEELLDRVIGAAKKAIGINGNLAEEVSINNDKVLEVLEYLRGESNATALSLVTTLFLILPAEALKVAASMLGRAVQMRLLEGTMESIVKEVRNDYV